MKDIRELLRDADPLRDEPAWLSGQHDLRRQAILAAADVHPQGAARLRPRMAVYATVALTVMAASLLGPRVWSVFVGDLQAAAIRFEIRLAENSSAPGLHEAKVSGSDRSIYLHDQVIVTNGDIATARVVPGPGPSEYYVGIEFNAAGAGKMRAATGNHIGNLMAILLDGRVVMAPVLRSPIGASARITGHFTRTQAERIVNGIEMQ
jgi:SecDF, P1 head subdomain